MMKNKLYFTFLIIILNSLLLTNNANSNSEFLTLKNSKVNLRQGPSFDYPIKLIYKKKYLPVIILNKIETWRQIKDHQNNSGWIHISQLSKKKSAININENSIVYKNPTVYSKPIVKLKIGRLVLIKKCKKEWCQIETGNYKGWTLKKFLWGRT
mgnify:FL=1|tara:strand:- start:1688 stop:2149 length:462 start_codon:yes stop_codon:yes gene_type:complete